MVVIAERKRLKSLKKQMASLFDLVENAFMCCESIAKVNAHANGAHDAELKKALERRNERVLQLMDEYQKKLGDVARQTHDEIEAMKKQMV